MFKPDRDTLPSFEKTDKSRTEKMLTWDNARFAARFVR